MGYIFDTLIGISFMVALACSLNLLMGYSGQFSMATAAFYAVGAFTYSFFSDPGGSNREPGSILGPHWPWVACIFVAIAVAAFVGFITSLPAVRRVRGDYVILLTLALQYVIQQSSFTFQSVTGGMQGITVVPIAIGKVSFSEPRYGFILALVVTGFIVAFGWIVGKWGYGRILRGIREDEEALRALGKGTALPKSLAFTVSAGMAGLAGAIAVAYLRFISAGTFSVDLAILAAAAVALGGPGNMLGVVIAAVALNAIGPILTQVGLSSTASIPWQYVVIGLVIVLGVRFRSQGLIPEGRRLFRRTKSSAATALAEESATDNLGEGLH